MTCLLSSWYASLNGEPLVEVKRCNELSLYISVFVERSRHSLWKSVIFFVPSLTLLRFRTMLYSWASLCMSYVPGSRLSCIHYFCNWLSIKWVRKNQGNYSTEQEHMEMILEWRWINYHTYFIDGCVQCKRDCLSKYAWEYCCMIECKQSSWKYTR